MIVSCGEALVDLVPDPAPGGGPLNVAVAAARLGAPSAFVGCVSTDEHGQMIWDHLRENGVDVSAATRDDAPTARAIVEHTPELRFRFEGEDTADTRLGHVDLSTLGPGPHLVHGGTLGLFRGVTADNLAALAESHTGVVSLDPNVRPQIIADRTAWRRYHDRWLRRAALYKASREDLSWIWPHRTPDECAADLVVEGVGAVVVTDGAEGISVTTVGGRVEVPTPRVDVVDTVGAGDTVAAAVLASLWDLGVAGDPEALSGLEPEVWRAIASRAARAAAITCSRPGADPPTLAELDG